MTDAQNLDRALQFGFDSLGRPFFPLLFKAAFFSGFTAVFAAILVLATCWAVSALWFICGAARGSRTTPQRSVQAALQLLSILLGSVPGLCLGLTLSLFWAPSFALLLTTLAISISASPIRMSIAATRALERAQFSESSLWMGSLRLRTFQKHILPFLIARWGAWVPQIWISAIWMEATLTLLGLGAPHGTPTLGQLLTEGKDYSLEAPWIFASSVAALLVTSWAPPRLWRIGLRLRHRSSDER